MSHDKGMLLNTKFQVLIMSYKQQLSLVPKWVPLLTSFTFSFCQVRLRLLRSNTSSNGEFSCNLIGPPVHRSLVKRYSGCVCVRVFLDYINTWIGRLSKTNGLPQCGWASSNAFRAWVEEKLSNRDFTPPAWGSSSEDKGNLNK